METTGNNYHSRTGGEAGKSDRGSGSVFSRNLELKPTDEPSGRRKVEAARMSLPLEAEEKQTYFQVEARKVVDILGEEIERLGSSRETQELVEELYAGWLALWGEEKISPAAEFTFMFEVARNAFRQAGRLGRKGLAPPERLTMSRLLQGMKGLVQGEGDREYFHWCRETANRCTRMIVAWSSRPETTGDGTGGEEPDKPAQTGRLDSELDISKSVDEWFVQVSNLVSHPVEAEQPAAVKPLEDEPAPELEAEPASTGEQRTAGPEEAASALAAEAPAGIRESARDLPESPAHEPEAVGEEAEDSTLAGAYFVENCRETLEFVRNSLDRLSGPSSPKVSRLLDSYLGHVLGLAQDFGFRGVDEALESLRQDLQKIAVELERGGLPAGREIEAVKRAVSRLEQDCGQVVCSS